MPAEHSKDSVLGLNGPGKIDQTGPDAGTRPHEANFDGATRNLTDAQYLKLMEYINSSIANPPMYHVLGIGDDPLRPGKNCTQWAISAWRSSGLSDEFGVTSWNFSPYDQWIGKAISDAIGTLPDPLIKVVRYRYADPLILDLDGDGFEITPLSTGIIFDANGDNIKTGMAWAGADDGMLVWDRNGNGSIDSGRELFGDETLLANGQKAAHGFSALSELDKGSLVNGTVVGANDGVFDIKDAQYASLRIWRDLNQDGISQSNELKTLIETGVTNIKLGSNAASTSYRDAILAQSSTFTRADGSTGQAGSFILAQNNFLRQFAPNPVSDAAKALPDLKGSGWVRDLREAATLSPELIALVDQAKNAPTRAGYKDAVARLLREWGNESSYASTSKQAMNAGYGLTLSDPVDAQEVGWMDKAIKASEADRNAYRESLTAIDRSKFDAMRERMVGGLEKLYAYEAFTGFSFLNWSQVRGDAFNYAPRFTAEGNVPIEVWVPLSQIIYENRNAFASNQAGYIRINIPAPLTGTPHLDTLWNRLIDDAASNLLPSLRLSAYIDMVDLNFTETGMSCDFSRLNASLLSASAIDLQEGTALLLDLYGKYGPMLDQNGWDGAQRVRVLMRRSLSEAAIHEAFVATGAAYFTAGATTGTELADIFTGGANASASAASAPLKSAAGNRIFTIICTCAFSAWPDPTTDFLMRFAAYSPTGRPRLAGVISTTPRACPSCSAERAPAETKVSSTAASSGRY